MVIRDIRNAEPHLRVVSITIVMTINLVPVEIARGDVATRAGTRSSGVKLFLTQINRPERIKQRACVRAETLAVWSATRSEEEAKEETKRRERRNWSEMDNEQR